MPDIPQDTQKKKKTRACARRGGSTHLGHHGVVEAGDHAHDLPHGAHLQDVLQLVLQDTHGEVALLDAVHDLLLHLILWNHILYYNDHIRSMLVYSYNMHGGCGSDDDVDDVSSSFV